jgi:hypothetical protein
VSVSQSNLNLPKSFYISAQIPRLFGLEKTNQLLASNMLQGKPWAVLDQVFIICKARQTISARHVGVWNKVEWSPIY